MQKPSRKFGYHVALGGGTLNRGHSEKDVDLYFLPLNGETQQSKRLQDHLESLWGESEEIGDSVLYPGGGVKPYEKRLSFYPNDRRIDVFIIEGQ